MVAFRFYHFFDSICHYTLSFPDMLKEAVNCENYEDVSLFTSIPLKKQLSTVYTKFMLINQVNHSEKCLFLKNY